ncbi:MAG TPA: acyltransferase [Candidatus Acidoferrum sp.]|nr:acyltransferase [Candidatus Acidoferrum sp.]
MEPSSSSTRIPELDGIRGIAILSVLCFHYLSMEGLTAQGSITDRLQRLVILGGTGVDLFFVLSGFLIGGILLDVKESPRFFSTFYIRRFFRIFPVYYAWITAYILVAAFGGKRLLALSHSGKAPPLDFDIYNHYLFIQNFFLDRLHNLAGSWFDHTWSLAVEEQFYVLIPLLIWLFSRRALKLFLFFVVFSQPLLRVLLFKTAWVSAGLIGQLTLTRADVLAFGVLAAVYWRDESTRTWLQKNPRWIYAALFILFIGFAAFWKWSPYERAFAMEAVGFSTIAMFYTVLLAAALCIPNGPIAALTRSNLLRQIGAVSYCMYLIHLVVDVACHAVILHATPKTSNLRGAFVTVFAAVLTFAIAKVSWVILERPCLRFGHTFRYGP